MGHTFIHHYIYCMFVINYRFHAMVRDVLSKLAMAYNWKPLVSSSNPTGGALAV